MLTTDRRPRWVAAVAIIMALPAGQFPMLLQACPTQPEIARTLVWCYPFYVIAAAWLAYLCWPRRKEMTWILLALMALTHIGMWMLVGQL